MQIPKADSSISPSPVNGRGGQGVRAGSGQGASSTGNNNDTRLKQACQQFEGQFFDLMLQEMRKTIPKDQLLGDDGHAEEIFTGMMDDQISQDMAKQGGPNDLADQLYRQISGGSSQSAPAQSSLGTEIPSTNTISSLAASGALPGVASSASSSVTGRGGLGVRASTPEDNEKSR